MKVLHVIGKESNQTRVKNEKFCFFHLSKYMGNEKRSSEEVFDVTGARRGRVRFCFSSCMTGYKQPILPCYATLTAFKTLPVSLWLSVEKATSYTSEIASKKPNVC